MKKIIMISGKAGAGKSTTANIIQQHISNSEIISFATKFKEMAKEHFFWDGEKDVRGRNLLQNLGKVGREYYLDIWVYYITEYIKQSDKEVFIIDDWRFNNEYEYISNMMSNDNIYTIRINRLNFVSTLTQEQQNNISEIELDEFDFDYKINSCPDNNLDVLEEKILMVLKDIEGDVIEC